MQWTSVQRRDQADLAEAMLIVRAAQAYRDQAEVIMSPRATIVYYNQAGVMLSTVTSTIIRFLMLHQAMVTAAAPGGAVALAMAERGIPVAIPEYGSSLAEHGSSGTEH